MADWLPDHVEPYRNISPKAYEHPADRAATAALKSVPMLDTVVRKLIEWRKSPNDPWQSDKRWNFEPGQRSIIYVGKHGPRVRLG